MEVFEVVYMDGLVEVFETPDGVNIEPSTLKVGAVSIERDKVRRWRLFTMESGS